MWLPVQQQQQDSDVGSMAAGTADGTSNHSAAPLHCTHDDGEDDDMFAEEDVAPAAPSELLKFSAKEHEETANVSLATAGVPPSLESAVSKGAVSNMLQGDDKVALISNPVDSGTHGKIGGPIPGELGEGTLEEHQASAALPSTDFGSWPIKEIKRFLSENGVDLSDSLEKGDLMSKARVLEARLAQQASAGAAVPAGYLFDEGSGYWLHAETGMYFDSNSGSYFDGTSWSRYDEATGAYVPVSY
jgi:hypothetical protein